MAVTGAWTINDWLAAGRPKKGTTWSLCKCSAQLELAASPADRAAWFSRDTCYGCHTQAERVKGMTWSPSLGGFIATPETIAAPPDAYVPTYTPPPVIQPSIPGPEAVSPQTSITNAPAGAGPAPQEPTMALDLGTLGLLGGTAVGGPIGGTLGSALGGAINLGGSVCSGPYNYNSATGMCVPKADCRQRDPTNACVAYPAGGSSMIGISGPGATGLTDPGYTGASSGPCPTGYTWNGTQCVASGISGAVQRFLPGGQTGTGMDVYGSAGIDEFGHMYIEPYVYSQPMRRCPPGTVLGKNNRCYDKIANKDRMWPRGPRPLMTGGEMKVLRRAEMLKKKVKRLATTSGFTCRKR